MTPFVILDAGPLTAFLDRKDPFHLWTREQFKNRSGVLLSCEAVLSESVFMLRKLPTGVHILTNFLRSLPMIVPPLYDSRKTRVLDLLDQYSNVPMSFADACLVQLSELYPDAPILTLDSDFLIYRRNKNERLPVVLPDERR
jgi:predicted nucleic acid-binding protein